MSQKPPIIVPKLIVPRKDPYGILIPSILTPPFADQLYDRTYHLTTESLGQLVEDGISTVSATFAKFLGLNIETPTMPSLSNMINSDDELVCFFNYDACGLNVLAKLTDDSNILKNGVTHIVSSSIPSATVPATAALMTALYSYIHFKLGWIEPVDERTFVKTFFGVNNYTKVNEHRFPENGNAIPYVCNQDCNREVFAFVPEWHHDFDNGKANVIHYKNFKEALEKAIEICKQPGKKFFYFYNPEPDATLHRIEFNSPEAKALLEHITTDHLWFLKYIEMLLAGTNKKASVYYCSDHDMAPCKEIPIFENEKIMRTLRIFPKNPAKDPTASIWLENGCAVFEIKEGKMQAFFQEFHNAGYDKDFRLVKATKAVDAGLFGPADRESADKLKRFLGYNTYIAISCSPENYNFKFYAKQNEKINRDGSTKEDIILNNHSTISTLYCCLGGHKVTGDAIYYISLNPDLVSNASSISL